MIVTVQVDGLTVDSTGTNGESLGPKEFTIKEAFCFVDFMQPMNPGLVLSVIESDGTIFWTNAT